MRIILGIICLLFGGIGWLGQLISGINFPLAQRLGLQEKSEGADSLYLQAELKAARWDSFVLWTLAAAGILMLINHYWWPYLSLIAGGIYLDGGGREAAKYLSLRKSGVKVGTSKDTKLAAAFFTLMIVVALWVIIYAMWFLAAPGK